jgi:hypothetical protein
MPPHQSERLAAPGERPGGLTLGPDSRRYLLTCAVTSIVDMSLADSGDFCRRCYQFLLIERCARRSDRPKRVRGCLYPETVESPFMLTNLLRC